MLGLAVARTLPTYVFVGEIASHQLQTDGAEVESMAGVSVIGLKKGCSGEPSSRSEISSGALNLVAQAIVRILPNPFLAFGGTLCFSRKCVVIREAVVDKAQRQPARRQMSACASASTAGQGESAFV